MRIHFTPNDVMQIIAECDIESMALKYWLAEYLKHGEKVLEIHPDGTKLLPTTSY